MTSHDTWDEVSLTLERRWARPSSALSRARMMSIVLKSRLVSSARRRGRVSGGMPLGRRPHLASCHELALST